MPLPSSFLSPGLCCLSHSPVPGSVLLVSDFFLSEFLSPPWLGPREVSPRPRPRPGLWSAVSRVSRSRSLRVSAPERRGLERRRPGGAGPRGRAGRSLAGPSPAGGGGPARRPLGAFKERAGAGGGGCGGGRGARGVGARGAALGVRSGRRRLGAGGAAREPRGAGQLGGARRRDMAQAGRTGEGGRRGQGRGSGEGPRGPKGGGLRGQVNRLLAQVGVGPRGRGGRRRGRTQARAEGARRAPRPSCAHSHLAGHRVPLATAPL